jgi:hypothetical protein
MAHGKLQQKGLHQEPGRTRNPKTTKGWEETVERPGIKNDLRNRGLSQQLRSKTGIKDPHTRQQLRLENKKTTSMIIARPSGWRS